MEAGELRFEKFARSARRKRYFLSGYFIVGGISFAFEGLKELLPGVSWAGLGVWRYYSKSSLEKAYDRYIEEKELYSNTDIGNNLSWQMFPLPGKGIGGVLLLEF